MGEDFCWQAWTFEADGGFYMIEGPNQLQQVVLCSPHTGFIGHDYTYTIQTNKQIHTK